MLRGVGGVFLGVVPNNLPVQTTTFIGRERETADVARQLADTRLLTITGAGGCGKTRLSLEAAHGLMQHFPDGIWWVDLAPITDPALVATTVAGVCSVREIPNQPILQTLARVFRDRDALIMLDNCEHVIQACAELTHAILSSTPTPTFMATSREPLGVAGEVTLRIPSLSFPPDHANSTIESLDQYESVRLFIDRAVRARSDFQATNESAPHIAEICHRLDGIPLAIELAAARTSALGVDRIASGLSDAFRVLTGGARTSLPRQRTIEASIDWSHDLLDARESTLFRRLGVFAGGFTLEAATSVCAGGDIEEAEIIDLLTGLVDKSLVQMEPAPRAGRYRLLETIRHYAGGKLAASGEADVIRNNHLDFMIALTGEAVADLEGAAHAKQVAALDLEVDNARAAMEFSLRQSDATGALRIASALLLYWEVRGVAEGLAWLRAGLDRPAEDRDSRAATLVAAALMSLTLGDPMSSTSFAEQAVALSREAGSSKVLARSLTFLGLTKAFMDPANAGALLDEAVEIGRATGDAYGLGESLLGRAVLELARGKLPSAREISLESIRAAEAGGNPILIARNWYFQGWVLSEMTRLGEAREALDKALALSVAAESPYWQNFSRAILSVVDLLEGNVELAQNDLQKGVAEAGELVSGFGIAIGLWCAGQAAFAAGVADAAFPIFEQGAMMQSAVGLRWLQIWTLTSRAEMEVAAGDIASAQVHIDEAAGPLRALPSPLAEGRIELARASIARHAEDIDGASDSTHRALQLFSEAGHAQGVVDALERLAILGVYVRSHESAARLIGAATAARESLGYARFPAHSPAFAEAEAGTLDSLGLDAFAAAAAEGAGLSLDQAIAYAARGRGERDRPAAGWASLTPAELDVVRLVAAGLTNAAIGTRLFISPRTVQAHLARVFGKLSVSSRTEVAAEAIKRGISGADA